MQKDPVTIEGAAALEKELNDLIKYKALGLIQATDDKVETGGLKENSEYHAAREKQEVIEERVHELNSKLSSLQVVDVSHLLNSNKVMFAAVVKLYNLESHEKVAYKIVGEDEADLNEKKISYKSPLAQALMGKSKDEVVKVRTPGGAVQYEIIDVKYK